MWPVVPLTDRANRCGMRNVQLFRLDPNPKLFAYHHSQEAEQGDDARRRTLHADQTVQKSLHPWADLITNAKFVHVGKVSFA